MRGLGDYPGPAQMVDIPWLPAYPVRKPFVAAGRSYDRGETYSDENPRNIRKLVAAGLIQDPIGGR